MTKKLLLLAAGVLTALAFAALPAGASAEEMEAHCSAAPCEGVVASVGVARLTNDGGLSITCQKTTGTVTQTAATSKTVNVFLTFDECKDPVFGGNCTSAGEAAGSIATNTMVGHLITIEKGKPATAGILLTGVNVTFECPFVPKKTVTGNIIGTFEETYVAGGVHTTGSMCGKAATRHYINFTQSAAGQQTHKTFTGGTFDLLDNGTTASQTGTGSITYGGGRTVTITC